MTNRTRSLRPLIAYGIAAATVTAGLALGQGDAHAATPAWQCPINLGHRGPLDDGIEAVYAPADVLEACVSGVTV